MRQVLLLADLCGIVRLKSTYLPQILPRDFSMMHVILWGFLAADKCHIFKGSLIFKVAFLVGILPISNGTKMKKGDLQTISFYMFNSGQNMIHLRYWWDDRSKESTILLFVWIWFWVYLHISCFVHRVGYSWVLGRFSFRMVFLHTRVWLALFQMTAATYSL